MEYGSSVLCGLAICCWVNAAVAIPNILVNYNPLDCGGYVVGEGAGNPWIFSVMNDGDSDLSSPFPEFLSVDWTCLISPASSTS